MTPLWAWYNRVAGRAWALREWDCFSLLRDGQRVAGLVPAFVPDYGTADGSGMSAQRVFARQMSRGLRQFRKIETPIPGAGVLFREGRVPIHVGLWMAPNLMAHANIETATTLAEFGPGTDYHFCFEGFYVPI